MIGRLTRFTPSPRRGFSLLEMMVAIGLALALFGSLYVFLHNLLSGRQRALDLAAKQLAASTLIERVESDLVACLVADADAGAGIGGETNRMRILSRGVAAPLAERGVDDPDVFGDLQLAEYEFDATSKRVRARRGPAADAGTFSPMGGEVYKVRFRYHDGSMWRDTFDSQQAGRLPLAVEIAVWFHAWPGADDVQESPVPTLERLTFDATGGFDEQSAQWQSELDRMGEPRPDRIRVMAVPDPGPPDSDELEASDDFLASNP